MQPFNTGMPATSFELSLLATRYRSDPLQKFFTDLNKHISMLHPDVLALLYHFGACAKGPLLELGPYVGGSTVSMARGVTDSGGSTRITSVEMGGRYDHPTYATTDIVESLRANLKTYGVNGRVNLIVGHSREKPTLDSVTIVAEQEGPFTCLMIDADGQVEEDIALYGRLLAPRCYLIVDDYYAPGAPEKEATTRNQLVALEQRGVVESFGVHGWGTWFGRFI
jgi:predicted O-methyltransferase YrrM